MVKTKMRWLVGLAAGATLLSSAVMGMGVAQAATKHKHYTVAYMSYGVANSYDAPMLAAAKAVAGASGVRVVVFDSQSSYTTQAAQLQNVINSGQYQGIIVQPIYGAALISTVQKAIKKGIKVVTNMGAANPLVAGARRPLRRRRAKRRRSRWKSTSTSAKTYD